MQNVESHAAGRVRPAAWTLYGTINTMLRTHPGGEQS